MTRRNLVKFMGAVPFLSLLPVVANAEKAAKANAKAKKAAGPTPKPDMVSESEPLAKAMQYRHKASEAPAMRTNKKAFCDNCDKYNVCAPADKTCKPMSAEKLKKSDYAACSIFPKKMVAAKGWCVSWQIKS